MQVCSTLKKASSYVLNLIINLLNIDKEMGELKERIGEVLNLIINGLPSKLKDTVFYLLFV